MTIRIYLEKYEPSNANLSVNEALKPLIDFAFTTSKIAELTNKQHPDVIT